jgi:hypothetical protein
MKKLSFGVVVFLLLTGFSTQRAFAGPPFNNLEGVGGVAFNPLAWLADSSGDNSHLKSGDTDILGKPRFGVWYVNLNQNQPNIDWTSWGLAESFFDRLELSYGYETVAFKASTLPTVYKHDLGAKLLLVPENGYGVTGLPALSVGAIYKSTTFPQEITQAGLGVDKSSSTGTDFYAVVTKLIGDIPTPILLSAGALDTSELVTGVLGYDNQSQITGFGNIDVILPENIVVGFEYKQGAQYTDSNKFKNSDYWDAHLAWIANSNLTLIAAFADTGAPLQNDQTAGDSIGLGNGVVISSQYAF